MATAGLSDLFRERSGDDRIRLENFSSASLALAINSDPGPFLAALEPLAGWVPGSCAKAHAGSLRVDLRTVTSVVAETQVSLFRRPEFDQGGTLDLVVTIDAMGTIQEVWVEVKVDAPFGIRPADVDGRPRDQLDVYIGHRPLRRDGRPDDPFLVTLTKNVGRPGVIPGLRWLDLYTTARATGEGNFMWRELARFLEQYAIVSPPLPSDLENWSAFVPVFEAVNREMRHLWPPDPVLKNMHTIGVERQLNANLQAQGRLMLTAACISYGLRDAAAGPEWWIAVADGSGYPDRLKVPVDEVVAAAPQWFREQWSVVETFRADRTDIFEKRLPLDRDQEAATDWLRLALLEIYESKVIEPFLAARRRKNEINGTRRARLPEATGDTV